MNSKKIKGPINIVAARAQAIETLGMEPGITVTMENEVEFTIPSPLFLDDPRQQALDELRLSDKNDSSVELAKAVLGEDQHAEYIAAGGHSNDISLFWGQMTMEAKKNPNLPT